MSTILICQAKYIDDDISELQLIKGSFTFVLLSQMVLYIALDIDEIFTFVLSQGGS